MATPEGFARNPGKVHEFYNTRRLNMRAAEPNAAHLALSQLERELDGEAVIVTQNIDDLHERAGSRNVLHMHGGDREGRVAAAVPSGGMRRIGCCLPTAVRAAAERRPVRMSFGSAKSPIISDRIDGLLGTADIFAAIGTSGQVHPAAGFVQVAATCGGRTIELNLEPSEISPHFDEVRLGPATEIVPEWVSGLLDGA